ncbi:MAG: TPM domain-containing protein [Stenotrophobium sp.]
MNTFSRLLKHAFTGHLVARRAFPKAKLQAIENAVHTCESQHGGEIRFAVEASLHASAIWHGLTPRERAIQVFSDLRVWNTEHNNGVLIYVLLADRAVEIVADRGVAQGHVPQREWDAVCREMEKHFGAGLFETGSVAGVQAVADILARYPAGPRDAGNELPDAPVILP